MNLCRIENSYLNCKFALSKIHQLVYSSLSVYSEPQYAILPCLFFPLGSCLIYRKEHYSNWLRDLFSNDFSMLFWVLGPSPSYRRDIGSEWNSQISKKKLQCACSNQEIVIVRIMSVNIGRDIKISCIP